jgi:hypothetical protein
MAPKVISWLKQREGNVSCFQATSMIQLGRKLNAARKSSSQRILPVDDGIRQKEGSNQAFRGRGFFH